MSSTPIVQATLATSAVFVMAVSTLAVVATVLASLTMGDIAPVIEAGWRRP
ncbi:MAG: hypothetical protein ABWX92_09615 [Mycetocola sp.]